MERNDNLVQILAILYLLSEYGRLGRYQISKTLKLGEGVVRRILKYLKDEGLIVSSKGGSSLTLKGKRFLRKLFDKFNIKKMREVNVTKVVGSDYLGVGICCKALLGDILRIRDEAVRGGAEGALILKFEGGRLVMPYMDSEAVPVLQDFIESITKIFEPSEGDIVIIGFNKDLGRALVGAIRAALLSCKSRCQ